VNAHAPRVASVTVAFNPEPARLAEQVHALRGQVDEIIVVDNGSTPPVAQLLPGLPQVRHVALGGNEGIARGFNAGIAQARAGGAEFVLLLDHDSVPAPGMVALLVAACRRRENVPGAPPVAAAGPRVNDSRNPREYPFIRLGWLRNGHLRCAAGDAELACDFLISSGSLIPMAALSALGDFDAALFIDSVDLEWCCRARDRGFALYGVCAARLDHRLGDRRRAVLNGLELVVHSPERIYYMTRNRILLYQRPYVPLKWKLKDLLRVLAKFAALMLFVAPRAEYLRMTGRGIRDALARRGGKLGG
jgi:rhamnosyltransferase